MRDIHIDARLPRSGSGSVGDIIIVVRAVEWPVGGVAEIGQGGLIRVGR